MTTEKGLLNFYYNVDECIAGLTYLFTQNFNQTGNALCAGSLMVLFGLICLRYKTKEYIAKNKLLNLLIYSVLFQEI